MSSFSSIIKKNLLASSLNKESFTESTINFSDRDWNVANMILIPTKNHRSLVGGYGPSPYSNNTILNSLSTLSKEGNFSAASRAISNQTMTIQSPFRMATPKYHALKFFSLQMVEDLLIRSEINIFKMLTKLEWMRVHVEHDNSAVKCPEGTYSILAGNLYLFLPFPHLARDNTLIDVPDDINMPNLIDNSMKHIIFLKTFFPHNFNNIKLKNNNNINFSNAHQIFFRY
jgi:hypothetical protein